MILGTYQPLSVINTLQGKEPKEDLNIFCFCADSPLDCLTYSYLAAPNYPECLILFEANNYECFDVVKLNQCIRSYDHSKNYSEFVDNEINIAKEAREYVVHDLPRKNGSLELDLLFVCKVKESLDSIFYLQDILHPEVKRRSYKIEPIQKRAKKMIQSGFVDDCGITDQNQLRMLVMVEAFKTMILPMIVLYIPFYFSESCDRKFYSYLSRNQIEKISYKLNGLYGGDYGTLYDINYENQKKLVEEIQALFLN